MTDAVDHARILANWQTATSWVTDQWLTVHRIENTIGRPHWDVVMRRTLDRPDP